MRVLIVEGSADCAELLQFMLQHAFVVTLAKTAKEARTLCQSTTFDVLLLSLALPDEDGWNLFTSLKPLSSAPAIAVSGLSDPKSIQRTLDMGFAAHLVKPIEPELLFMTLRRACGEASAGDDEGLSTSSR